jgi:hypothetical protein
LAGRKGVYACLRRACPPTTKIYRNKDGLLDFAPVGAYNLVKLYFGYRPTSDILASLRRQMTRKVSIGEVVPLPRNDSDRADELGAIVPAHVWNAPTPPMSAT